MATDALSFIGVSLVLDFIGGGSPLQVRLRLCGSFDDNRGWAILLPSSSEHEGTIKANRKVHAHTFVCNFLFFSYRSRNA